MVAVDTIDIRYMCRREMRERVLKWGGGSATNDVVFLSSNAPFTPFIIFIVIERG